jgi:hypothetical protein
MPWLKPVYIDEMTGLKGYTQDQLAMIQAGYACGECGEVYGMYSPSCPVKGCTFSVADIIMVDTPPEWRRSPAEEDYELTPASIDDAIHTDTALGELGRWLKKKKGL